ncbi:unnamed protein product [Sphagnum balticum]
MVIILDLDSMEINLVRYTNVDCLKMSSNCWSLESPALGLMKENVVFCACISVAHLASARRKSSIDVCPHLKLD